MLTLFISFNNQFRVLFDYFVKLFQEVAVQANYSAKIIVADFRQDPAAEVLQDMYTTVELASKFPETVIGFDLDGPEV